jgi:RNA polymerase sigma-70 factor, ECF subfamily
MIVLRWPTTELRLFCQLPVSLCEIYPDKIMQRTTKRHIDLDRYMWRVERADPVDQGDSLMTIASEQLWDTFRAPLYQFIRRRVSDAHSAEDILQDVFLKIHAHIDTLRTHDRLASWIYQITRNAIADYYRARRPTAELAETLPIADEVVDDDVLRELSPCVTAMVTALPKTYGEALRLTEYQGLSQKALSERLGISFSGARSRVQRARAKIKEQLLNCCQFQFDHGGRIIDYQSHRACSASEQRCTCATSG